MIRSLAGAAVLAALSAAPAHADLARLSATYDGTLSNTVFTITNTSAVSEALGLQTSLASPTFVSLPNLAAGATEQYAFNRVSGGFIVDPQSAGLPDTTTYALLVGLNNGPLVLTSARFSPVSNLTGAYVDFLGNTCQGFSFGCTVALAGTVASVPEPMSISLLLAGLTGLGLASRRRA